MSADDTDQFFQPPNTGGGNNNYAENQIYQVNSVLPVSWATKYVSYQFELWQQDIAGNSASKGPIIYSTEDDQASITDVQTFNWTIQTYTFDLSASPVFFIWAYSGDDDIFSSHYFNLTEETVSTTTTASVPGATATITQSAYTGTQTGSGPTSTSGPGQDNNNTDTGLSTGAKAGIGIGAAVGALLIIGIAIFFGYRLAKRRKTAKRSPTADNSGVYSPVARDGDDRPIREKTDAWQGGVPQRPADFHAPYTPAAELGPKTPAPALEPQELHGEGVVHELPASQRSW